MNPESRLAELGLTLPAPPVMGGNYISAKTVGQMVYLSGCISMDANGVITGTVGADRTVEEGYAAARACALTQLAVLKKHLGSLSRVAEIVGVNGYVNAVNGFSEPPKVINGFSDLMVEVFGEPGKAARSAFGVAALPNGMAVEIEAIFEIKD
jgi:enamine deaminase RidA (YjgF/YER057c/UK114 family)